MTATLPPDARPAKAVASAATPPGVALPKEEGLSPGKLWQIIRRRQFWFAITFGLSFTAMGLYTLQQWIFNPLFEGGFQLLVQDPLSDNRQQAGNQLDAVARVGGSVDVPNLIQVLASPMLLNPLARKLGLPEGSLVERVSVGLAAQNSDVLFVNLRWSNPEQGRTIIEALASDYLDYSLRQRKEKLKKGLEFLADQAPGLQQRVADLQQQLAEFRRTNLLVAPEEQSGQLVGARANLASQLLSLKQAEARLLEMQKVVRAGQLVSPFQSGQTTAQAGGSTDAGGGADPAANIQQSFSPLLSELVEVEKELATAQSSLRPDAPLVQSLEARRRQLRPLLQRRELESLQTALQVNAMQQAKLQEQMQDLATAFRRNPELIKQYEALQQRLDVARDNLSSYLQSRETFRLEVAQSTVPWQVISPPKFGVKPVQPNLQRNLLTALALGVLSGTGVAFLRDRIDHVFHSISEVEQELGLPVLAGIPFLPAADGQTIQAVVKDLDSQKRFGLRESLRNFYQALRTLRANHTLRVVALTSSASGEGKTTSTSLLGQTLADLGMRVLLVDADLRRPSLHRRLGVDNNRGWSELFAELPPPLEDLYQWISPNLALLPGGPRVPDPARLLSSARCGEVIAMFRAESQFDLILFDTPPALELVDPLFIAEHMDGLILLVSLGKISRNLPAQVMRKIRDADVDLLGTVLNQRVDRRMGYGYGYGYYGYYGYEYGYGYGYGRRYGYGYGAGDSYAPQSDTKPLNPWLARSRALAQRSMAWLDGEKIGRRDPIPTENRDDQSKG